MDSAVNRRTNAGRASSVEQCSCPAGYKGLSCEECAPGFTRSTEGLYLGLCRPCNCYGFSDTCDPETGVCEVGFSSGNASDGFFIVLVVVFAPHNMTNNENVALEGGGIT